MSEQYLYQAISSHGTMSFQVDYTQTCLYMAFLFIINETCFKGPVDTPYHGGIYLGKLVFPREFPFKPPAIYMITPNGRFKVNQK